jgi:diguanylate cyclase (GGDEF)-like protein
VSLADDHVTAAFRDHTGLIWIGTTFGLERHDPSTGAIATVFGGPGHPDGLSDPQVTAVAAARNGLVWVGLEEQGVEVFDPASHRVAALRPDANNPERALPGGSVNALAMAPDDTAWIGTDHGLYKADAAGRSVQLVRLEALRPTPYVRSLYATGDDVWIGTEDGLLRYRIALKEVRVYPADPDGSAGLSDSRVLAIQPAVDRRLWVGTLHGLNLLDPETGAVERMMPDAEDKNALSNGAISTLQIDPEGRLWVGSSGGGIDILEKSRDPQGRPVFRHLGTRDGLPDSSVDAFLSDGQGNIWASTDNRLAMVDTGTLQIRPMLAAEGVRIPTYWQQSAAATPHGDLVFGGTGGFTVVRPNLLHRQDLTPPIVVTDVRIGDRSIPVHRLNRANGAASLTLVPGDRGFQLEFAGLDLAAADRERYAYRLEGFDPGWIDAPQRVATYTNLPPGDYALHLRVQGRDANWVEAARPIAVHVKPSWYQTLWARVLGGLLVLGLFASFMQARTATLRRRRAELQLLVDKRTAELVAANERLEALATTDGLTGVLNRRRFMELALQELDRSRRLGHPLCVVLADLDFFKRINDTWGHLAGDTVLRVTAARFRAACRRIDTLARYGGEEFIILMPETGLDAAIAACERLRSSIAAMPIPVDGHELKVTVSVGIAGWSGGLEPLERIIDRADKALYTAKEKGRNRVEAAPETVA